MGCHRGRDRPDRTSSVASDVMCAVPVMVGSMSPGGAIQPAELRAETAADDALLHEGLAFRESPIRGETGEPRARAGAARRTVVGLARAEHEIPRALVEDDVIDLGKALRIHREPRAPREVGERIDVRARSSCWPCSSTRKNQLPP